MEVATNKPTILYVEDNPDNRLLIRRVLVSEGYDVVEAANARDAMARIQKIRSRPHSHGYQHARHGRLRTNLQTTRYP